ncbi:MAG: hypothetical protein ACOYI2_06030 [Bacillota bacterium]
MSVSYFNVHYIIGINPYIYGLAERPLLIKKILALFWLIIAGFILLVKNAQVDGLPTGGLKLYC